MKLSISIWRGMLFSVAASLLFLSVLSRAAPWPGPRVRLADASHEIRSASPVDAPRWTGRQLTTTELTEPRDFVISLRMRNFAGLQAILQTGGTVAKSDMEANYLPLKSDYDRISAWLAAEGLAITLVDVGHTNIFVRGSVEEIAAALKMDFARLAAADGEFTAATMAPSVPAEFAPVILGIDGLQSPGRLETPKIPTVGAAVVPHPTRVIPEDMMAAYNVPAGLNGAGQTIAVIMASVPLASDLTAFYLATGTTVPEGNFSVALVNGGPTPESQEAAFSEVTMNSEWSSGMAPGAKIRVYATESLTSVNLSAACTQILNEGLAKIVTHSASAPETSRSEASLQSSAQIFAQMAAAGITFFNGSGNNGTTGGAPNYPTSDPSVTGLSGTTVSFDANWRATDEVVWPQTGGGVSTFFARPAWQTGPGMPAGTMRLVPDAASISSCVTAVGTLFPLVIRNGQAVGVGGSSLTGPVWAGITAIVNQARANVGLPAVGLLGPRIYRLLGTNAFKDISVGTTGAYSAGAGYDLCSGLGSPNVSALVQALTSVPSIAAQPAPQSVITGGSVTFRIAANSSTTASYQWFRNGVAVPGATGSSYAIASVSLDDAGDYTVVVTNAAAAVTSVPATLTVFPAGTPSDARLFAISCRAQVGTGGDVLIPGIVLGGSGSRQVVVRAGGPAIQGVSGTLARPQLKLYQAGNSNPIATNTGWSSGTAGETAALQAAFTAANLPHYPIGSADCALLATLSAGNAYTAVVSGVGDTTGVALVEVYEIGAGDARMTALSCRAQVGTGGNILIPGLIILGTTPKQVIIRAKGPGIRGVPGVLARPTLAIFNGAGVKMAENTGWSSGNAAAVSAATVAVGLEPLAPDSGDCALVATLSPGGYTAQISGLDATSGVALVEVYEVP